MSVDAFGGKNGFDLTIKRDKAKYSKCLSMGKSNKIKTY